MCGRHFSVLHDGKFLRSHTNFAYSSMYVCVSMMVVCRMCWHRSALMCLPQPLIMDCADRNRETTFWRLMRRANNNDHNLSHFICCCSSVYEFCVMTTLLLMLLSTAATVLVSCPGCEIIGRSGFAFHSSHNSKSLRAWLPSGMVQVAGLQGDGSEDIPSE